LLQGRGGPPAEGGAALLPAQRQAQELIANVTAAGARLSLR